MYDSHLHTANSPDSKTTVEELCSVAIARGMSGIAITDHVDLVYPGRRDIFRTLQGSLSDAGRASRDNIGTLRVLRGVELAGSVYDQEAAHRILSLGDFDVVLGSVHWVCKDGFLMNTYGADYTAMGEAACYRYLGAYLSLVYETAAKAPVDVIAHISYPLRYMNGKHHMGVDIFCYRELLSQIFRVMIDRGIALEVNTASVDTLICDFVPSREVLSLYRSLGGRLLTLGSDAHTPDRLGKGFVEAKKMLRSLGFTEYHYFVSHTPIAVPL